tara:strand:+ start:1439 stop:2170 length:732 start_codon:yes stop_codon:yes gene_type:complete
MKAVLILQARMGSKRFPQKSLKPLFGKPLIYRILERVVICKNIDKIILAIPDTKENEPLEKIGASLDVEIFKGSEEDCLDRYYKAALEQGADYVLRLPADNFAPNHEEIDNILNFHLKNNPNGFSSNLAEVFNSGYPDGIGAEIFSFKLLEEVWKKNKDQKYREHVHLNFFDYSTQKPVNEAWCPVKSPICPKKYSRPDIILDVDTEEQYKYAESLYNYLYPRNKHFSIEDIIHWHDNIYGEN